VLGAPSARCRLHDRELRSDHLERPDRLADGIVSAVVVRAGPEVELHPVAVVLVKSPASPGAVRWVPPPSAFLALWARSCSRSKIRVAPLLSESVNPSTSGRWKRSLSAS